MVAIQKGDVGVLDFVHLDENELERIGIVFKYEDMASLFCKNVKDESAKRIGHLISLGMSENELELLDNCTVKQALAWMIKYCPESDEIIRETHKTMEMELIAFKTHVFGVALGEGDKDLSLVLVDELNLPHDIAVLINSKGLKTIGDLLRQGDLRCLFRTQLNAINTIREGLWDFLHDHIVAAERPAKPMQNYDIRKLVGQHVIHKSYGNGTIIEQTTSKLVVQFLTNQAEYPFPNGNTFPKFLVAEDSELNEVLIEVSKRLHGVALLPIEEPIPIDPQYPLIYNEGMYPCSEDLVYFRDGAIVDARPDEPKAIDDENKALKRVSVQELNTLSKDGNRKGPGNMIDFNRLDRKELESIGIVFLDQYTESEFRVSASREFHRRMDSAVWRGLSEKDPSFLDQIKKEKGKMEWYEAINPDSRSIAADIAYSMEMEIIAFKTHIDGVILCKEDKDLSGDLIETLDYPFAIKLRLKCVGIRTIGDLLRYGDLSHIDRLGQESIYLIKHTLWDYLHSRIVPAPKITAPIYKFDILNLIGRQVFHKRYGDGEVTGQTPTELIVKFKTRESKFSFPNQYTFSRYLVAKDPELQASMREMVTLYEAAKKSDLCGNGDLFFYPKYPLIYSSEKIRALGEHLDEGLPERSVDAIIKNHIVHEANMAMNNYDFNHPRFKPAMDNSAEEIVDKYLDEFKEYHLSPIGKSELRGFLRYLLQNKIKDIPYHFLIQAETDYVGVGFSNDLLGVIAKIKNKTLKIESWSESDLLSKPDKEKLLSCDVLGIRSALSDAKYYMNDYDSSGDSSKKQDYDYRWNDIMGFFDSHPNKLVFMCAPKNIAQGRIKNNTRMYYRFFKHRIIIGNMGEDEIIDSLMAKIKEAKIDYSLQFFDQIKEYIRTVYPKADLKNMEFVDDLYKWMLALSFQNLGTGLFFNDASIPFYHHKKTFDELNSDFQQLVGLDEVKQTFWDIGMLCQSLNSSATKPYLHMVFRGNPGTGKTTVANHIARLLNAMGVIRTSKVVEVMVGDLIAGYVGQTPFKVKRAIEKARGGVLFVDEAYMLDSESGGSHSDHYRQECIVTLMQAMDNRVDPIIIFAGYPKQMDDFLNANPGLVSRIGYNIEFKDYSDDQLVDIFRAMCESSGYEYDLLTLEAVRQKITALRYEKNFGNARTVENIFNQAAMECLRSDASRRFITQNHIVISKDIKTINELQRELDNLVGIESAKQIIHQQIMSNRFAKEQGKKLPTSNNMVFVGNAGTGKTTTAKLCAEMLFSIGVAKSPRTKLISAKDLYVQDVAKKLNEYCDDVMGGVLFIDEIYLLQKNAYISTEVISVLLDVLEQKKEDLTFILAGYEKQMDEFLSENQGLKSRFPITVHFNDFTLDELCQIFMKECREYEMQVSDDALEKFSAVIEKAMKQENFGNGRAVRNIFENAYRKHSVRYFSEEEVDPDCFTADDIDAPVEINEKKINLGFGN